MSHFQNVMRKLGSKTSKMDSTEALPFSHFINDDSPDEHPALDAVAVRAFHDNDESSLPEEDEELDDEFFQETARKVPFADLYRDYTGADHVKDYDMHAFVEPAADTITVNAADTKTEPGVGPMSSAIFRETETDNDMEDSPAPKLESMRKHLVTEKIPAIRRAIHGMDEMLHRETLRRFESKLAEYRSISEQLAEKWFDPTYSRHQNRQVSAKLYELSDLIQETMSQIAKLKRYMTIGSRALRFTAVVKTKCDLRKQRTQARATV